MFEKKIERYISVILASALYLIDTELSKTQLGQLEKIINHTELLRDEYVNNIQLPPLEFAGYLNHDARSPLSVIIGYSELLQSGLFGAVDDSQINGFGQILDCAYGITDLINEWVIQIRTSHGFASAV